MAEQESVYLWSNTAASNANSDPAINFSEGQLPSTLNNSNRAAMTAVARFIKDTNGSLTTGGSANAYTLTINGRQTAYATGLILAFKANFTNTSTATLNVTNADGAVLGAKQIRVGNDAGVVAGQIVQNAHYLVYYDTAATGGGGGFTIVNGGGNVIGPAATTDNAAMRADGTAGKIQDSALLIADTTGAISRSGAGGIQQEGTNTNDNAAAGQVGEVISSLIASGSAVSLTNNTAANMTSISLTAGDWDVYCNIIFLTTGTTVYNYLLNSINTTSATAAVAGGQYYAATYATAGVANSNLTNIGTWCGPFRVSIAGTTTVYGVAQAGFGVSTMAAYGLLYARRVR